MLMIAELTAILRDRINNLSNEKADLEKKVAKVS